MERSRMRIRWKAVAAGLAAGIVLGAGAGAAARDLGTREAREAIARLLGRASGEGFYNYAHRGR